MSLPSAPPEANILVKGFFIFFIGTNWYMMYTVAGQVSFVFDIQNKKKEKEGVELVKETNNITRSLREIKSLLSLF